MGPHAPCELSTLEISRDTEVSKLGDHVLGVRDVAVNEDVLGRDVSVHLAVAVQRVQAHHDLEDQLQVEIKVLFPAAIFLDELFQVTS